MTPTEVRLQEIKARVFPVGNHVTSDELLWLLALVEQYREELGTLISTVRDVAHHNGRIPAKAEEDALQHAERLLRGEEQ